MKVKPSLFAVVTGLLVSTFAPKAAAQVAQWPNDLDVAGFVSLRTSGNDPILASIPLTKVPVVTGPIIEPPHIDGDYAALLIDGAEPIEGPSYARFLTGEQAGHTFEIVDSYTGAVVIDLGGKPLAGAASGDVVSIVPHHTLGELRVAGDQQVQVLFTDNAADGVNKPPVAVFQYSQNGWQDEHGNPANDTVVAPDQTFILQPIRGANNVQVLVAGAVISGPVSNYLHSLSGGQPHNNHVGIPFPWPLSQQQLGLDHAPFAANVTIGGEPNAFVIQTNGGDGFSWEWTVDLQMNHGAIADQIVDGGDPRGPVLSAPIQAVDILPDGERIVRFALDTDSEASLFVSDDRENWTPRETLHRTDSGETEYVDGDELSTGQRFFTLLYYGDPDDDNAGDGIDLDVDCDGCADDEELNCDCKKICAEADAAEAKAKQAAKDAADAATAAVNAAAAARLAASKLARAERSLTRAQRLLRMALRRPVFPGDFAESGDRRYTAEDHANVQAERTRIDGLVNSGQISFGEGQRLKAELFKPEKWKELRERAAADQKMRIDKARKDLAAAKAKAKAAVAAAKKAADAAIAARTKADAAKKKADALADAAQKKREACNKCLEKCQQDKEASEAKAKADAEKRKKAQAAAAAAAATARAKAERARYLVRVMKELGIRLPKGVSEESVVRLVVKYYLLGPGARGATGGLSGLLGLGGKGVSSPIPLATLGAIEELYNLWFKLVNPSGRGILTLPRMILRQGLINPNTGKPYTESEAAKLVDEMAKFLNELRAAIAHERAA